jgi:hypothetical protein
VSIPPFAFWQDFSASAKQAIMIELIDVVATTVLWGTKGLGKGWCGFEGAGVLGRFREKRVK